MAGLTATANGSTGGAINHNISMGKICSAVVRHCHQIPVRENGDDEGRVNPLADRILIHQYIRSVRARMLRVLLIAQWVLRSMAPLEKLTSLNDFINDTDRTFRRYARRLRLRVAAQMERRLYPAWDVSTSMHLLRDGRYPWFPRKSAPSVSKDTILARLDSLIRRQLACSSLSRPMCNAKRSIGGGRLTFDVANEFSVTITLKIHDAKGRSELYWHILELNLNGRSGTAMVIRDCNQMLFDDASTSTILSDLYLRLHRGYIQEQVKLLHQSADVLADLHAYISVKWISDELTVDLYYWTSEKSITPLHGHVPINGEKSSSSNSIIRVTLDPPTLQHFPYFPGCTENLSASDPLSETVHQIINRRIQWRLKELYDFLSSSSADITCWEQLLVDSSALRVVIFRPSKLVTFPDGFFIEIGLAHESGMYIITSPYSTQNQFWQRLLRKLALHLNSSPSKLHQILFAIAMNAVIEHFAQLAAITGFETIRKCPGSDLHSVCVRIPRFSTRGLFIELTDKTIVFRLCSDIDSVVRLPSTVEYLDFDLLLYDTTSLSTLRKQLSHRAVPALDVPIFILLQKHLERVTADKFREMMQSCQSKILIQMLSRAQDASEFVSCSYRTACWRLELPGEAGIPLLLNVLVSCQSSRFWSASIDCSTLNVGLINTLSSFKETPGFSTDSINMIVRLLYPIDGAKLLQSNPMSICRKEVLIFLYMASLYAQFRSIQSSPDEDYCSVADRFSLEVLFHKKAYIKSSSGLTVVIGIQSSSDTLRYSVRFLPREFPQRMYLEHLLNATPDGLFHLLLIVLRCEHMLNEVFDFLQSINSNEYIGPDIDVVAESPTCLRLVYRNAKMAVQLLSDIRFLPGDVVLMEFSPGDEPSLKLSSTESFREALSCWKQKCYSIAEYSVVSDLLEKKETMSLDPTQWGLQNGVEFKLNPENQSINVEVSNPELEIVRDYIKKKAVGNQMLGFARLCYMPQIAFEQIVTILRALEDDDTLLAARLILQCRMPWSFVPQTQTISVCVEFCNSEIGSCILRLQFSMKSRSISLAGSTSDSDLLNGYLVGWDHESIGSAVLLLRKRSLVDLAILKTKQIM